MCKCTPDAVYPRHQSCTLSYRILLAIEHKVAQREAYAFSCSKTIRTTRPRTSGKYLFDWLIVQSPQEMESPQIPGRFKQSSVTGQGAKLTWDGLVDQFAGR